MSEDLKSTGAHPHNEAVPLHRQNESEVVGLIKKIQQHLVYLEKKIDTLISQSSGSSPKGGSFSKPHRSFGRPPWRGKGKHEGHSGNVGAAHSQERRFDQPRGSENRGGENRGFFRSKKRS